MNIIEVQNVTKRFDKHVALEDVSLSIPEGVVFGLLGPNGAGKTTLIRMIMRMSYPDAGTILFKGHAVSDDDSSDMGYLPEERGLYKKMKVGEQAMYFARLKGLERNEAYKRLREKFEQFDIMQWWNRPVEELSKGMQQKVQFITTILHKPSFLILDEPFSGFDPINAELLKSEILDLKKNGTTIVLSTHNMASVEEICDHIALINKSHKILDGDIFEIKNRFKKNIFSVELSDVAENFESSLQADKFELISKEQLPHTIRYQLKIHDDQNVPEFLNICMKEAQIRSFVEIMPSMNEIFIEQVQISNAE